ncbi:MAG: MBL fold metallo-hydrolase [Acidimicrobiia bacterium]|nr:MBL fold metallo-hydrolase [Acidimicrobiia bacterium]
MSLPFDEVGDGIFRRHYESLDLNVGVLVTDDGVAVIDTRATPDQARELADDIRALTSAPVRWVINTHHHWDHTFGNEVFADAAIWGHRLCAAALRDSGEAMREGMLSMVVPDEQAAISAIKITPPDHLFDNTAATLIGDRRVQLRYLGRGHTDNDIVVVVDKVVFAGDLIEEGNPPFFGDSYPLEWPATVRGLLGLGVDRFVPGHGDIVDAGFVENQATELEAVAALCRFYSGEPVDALDGPYPSDVLATAIARIPR